MSRLPPHNHLGWRRRSSASSDFHGGGENLPRCINVACPISVPIIPLVSCFYIQASDDKIALCSHLAPHYNRQFRCSLYCPSRWTNRGKQIHLGQRVARLFAFVRQKLTVLFSANPITINMDLYFHMCNRELFRWCGYWNFPPQSARVRKLWLFYLLNFHRQTLPRDPHISLVCVEQ